ncbi:MAG: hypothetical protein HXY29_12445 [Rhodocyclaceae bacterium]|jgi:hypothetical protein|nr:hypothetical protein [Rhodocyclaceae bacterium]
MYARLADFPVLDTYASRIPAVVWNVWRRTLRHTMRVAQRRFDLPGLEPLQAILEERLWVCIDPTLGDAPIIAWQRFEDAGRSDLSAPVPCTVLQYHFGASRFREAILLTIGAELERHLKAERT